MTQISTNKTKLEFVLASVLAFVPTITLLVATTNTVWATPQQTSPTAKGERANMANTPIAKSITKSVTKSVIISGEKAAQLSYGDNIEKANLIVRAAYNDSSLVVKQVLKGDKTWLGKTIKLASPIKMGCRQQSVPAIANAAILLHGNNKNDFSVVEIYDTPDQIAFLKCFIPIYADNSAKGEHAKILALSKLFVDSKQSSETFESDPTATFKKEFVYALNNMHQPENFDLVKELYLRPTLSAQDKLSLQEWMANTGDPRAVDVLYQALKSDDKFINSSALSHLTYNYKNPATDKAIAAVYNTLPKESKPTAANYLLKRGANKLVSGPALTANTAQAATPFQKATELEQQGKIKEAQTIYMSIIESKDDNSYAIPFAINKVLVDNSLRNKVLQARLPWLTKLAATGNYLEAQDAALILRKLNSASCLDALMAILGNRQSLFSRANQTATFAIVDLGATARKRAAIALIKEIESNTALTQKYDEQTNMLLELAFIQDNADQVKAQKALADKQIWASSCTQLQPLLSGLPSQDEGLFLIQKLKEQKLPSSANDWIIFRLGDMQEARAITALMTEFKKPYSSSATTAREALEKIAKVKTATEQITKELKSIAQDSHSLSQANAIELLAAIEGQNALPVVRQVVKNGQLDAKVRALSIISRIGNKDDMALLLPMSNYWTADRSLHYWAMQALGEIKNR